MDEKEKHINKALEFVASKHNGELPYRLNPREYAKLMHDYSMFILLKYGDIKHYEETHPRRPA